jgi:hypothetical protein
MSGPQPDPVPSTPDQIAKAKVTAARLATNRPVAERLAGEWLLSYTIAGKNRYRLDDLTYTAADMRVAFLAGRASR